MNVTRFAGALAVLLMAVVMAGCGSSSTDNTARDLARLDDQSAIAAAEADLAQATIDGGPLQSKSLAVADAIRKARDAGVDDKELGKDIDDAEADVADLCDNCITILENAR